MLMIPAGPMRILFKTRLIAPTASSAIPVIPVNADQHLKPGSYGSTKTLTALRELAPLEPRLGRSDCTDTAGAVASFGSSVIVSTLLVEISAPECVRHFPRACSSHGCFPIIVMA